MLGPAPFRFELQAEKVEGAAFSIAFKTLTCAVVIFCGYWLLSLWLQGKFGGKADLEGLRTAGWFILGWGLLACTAWSVVTSRIRLDTYGITQSWLWTKHFDFVSVRLQDTDDGFDCSDDSVNLRTPCVRDDCDTQFVSTPLRFWPARSQTRRCSAARWRARRPNEGCAASRPCPRRVRYNSRPSRRHCNKGCRQ